jgi:hypothetical protein
MFDRALEFRPRSYGAAAGRRMQSEGLIAYLRRRVLGGELSRKPASEVLDVYCRSRTVLGRQDLATFKWQQREDAFVASTHFATETNIDIFTFI